MSAPETGRLDDWLRYLEGLHPVTVELGLERVRGVWERLDLDQNAVRIVIGGTNGKGSCAALIEGICANADLRTGLYTSPHLVRFNERIRIDRVEVSDQALVQALGRIDAARGEVSLTYFEFTTLAALLLFAEANLDVWILEVGLGGRLDAVNLIDADAALVTSIGLDHTEWLGNSLEQIALEKAGIYRPGAIAVCAQADAPRSLIEHAEQQGVALSLAGRDYQLQIESDRWHLTPIADRNSALRELPLPGLPGPFQCANAAGALELLRQLGRRLPISRRATDRGLRELRLAGRMQRIPGQPAWLLDVAHNTEAVRELAGQATLAGITRVVFGALDDKPIEQMLRELPANLRHWHLTPLDSPRSADPTRLRQALTAALPKAEVQLHENLRDAMSAARAAASPDETLLVFGSFHTVGGALDWLEREHATDA